MATKKQLEPVAPAADKKKALAAALSQIEKQFGKGSVMRLGENTGMTVERHSDRLDRRSTSRSASAACRAAASSRSTDPSPPARPRSLCTAWQRRRSSAARRRSSTQSTRSTRSTPRRSALTSTACWFRSRTPASRRLEIAEALVRSGAVDIVVIDSVAALTPRAEIEGEMGDSFVGLQARLMSQALRKLRRLDRQEPTASRSSSTSCAKRSASSTATRRPRPAAAP